MLRVGRTYSNYLLAIAITFLTGVHPSTWRPPIRESPLEQWFSNVSAPWSTFSTGFSNPEAFVVIWHNHIIPNTPRLPSFHFFNVKSPPLEHVLTDKRVFPTRTQYNSVHRGLKTTEQSTEAVLPALEQVRIAQPIFFSRLNKLI